MTTVGLSELVDIWDLDVWNNGIDQGCCSVVIVDLH